MRDELLNETLFMSLAHARVEIAAWAADYNRERPHSSQPRRGSPSNWKSNGLLRDAYRVRYAALCFNRADAARLKSQLEESWGSRQHLERLTRTRAGDHSER